MNENFHLLNGDRSDLSDHIFVAMGKMTSQMAILTDASRKIVWVNKAFTEITGYSPEEVVGKNPGMLLQGEASDPLVVERMRVALDAAKPFTEEILNYRKNGESYWVEVQVEPIFAADGELRGYFGLNENISQRKRDLHAVVTRQKRLEAERLSAYSRLDISLATMEGVLRCSPTPIVLVDPEHMITDFNPAAEALLGFSKEELVGKATPAIFHDFEDVIAKARQRGWLGNPDEVEFSDLVPLFQTGETTTEQWRLVAKNGDKIPALLALSILRNGQGETIGYMGVITDLRAQLAAEQKRQALTARLQKVAKHLPGFIYEFKLNADGSSSFPYASEGIEKIYGISPSEALADASNVWRAVHPEDVDRLKESIRLSADIVSFWSCDYRVVHADGVERWLSGSANPERQEDGAILWHGYIRDVTNRQQAETALRKKTALLQLLTETALDFINVPVQEADGAIEKALADVGQFFGIDRVYLFDYDFVKETSSNTHEWCAEGIEPFKDELQDKPIVWDSEWYFKHKQGEEVYIADVASMPECSVKDILSMQSIRSILTVPLMHQDKPIGFVGFDAVREHRQFSEEEILLLKVFSRALVSVRLRLEGYLDLKESRAQVDMFFDVSVGLVCVCDLNGHFLQVNHGWEVFLGLPKQSINGSPFMQYVHPDDRAATEQAMAALAHGKKVEGFINRFINSDGDWRSISWVSTSRNGKIFASARDVTAEREAAVALESALEDAKRIADMRSRLISMASHEFRTPLSSIRLSTEMLQSQMATAWQSQPTKLDKYLSRIIVSTDHLTRIITDVLEIEGSASREQAMEFVPLNPQLVCEDCLQSYIESHGITQQLTITSRQSIPQIRANETLLKSALNNLLDNAIKYSPEDSPIQVTIDCDDGNVKISVTDQGIGIPESEQSNIFDPFFRSSQTTHISGTGLGLSIALQNTERMGGTVLFSHNHPKGSIFTISLPILNTE